MGTLKDISYIEQIGIKKTLRSTNMGNVIHILNNGKKYKEFGADYSDLSDKINIEYKDSLLLQTEEHPNPVISFPEIVISDNEKLHGIVGDFELGNPLSEISLTYNIQRLISLLEYLEQQIKLISNKGWNLEDLHEDNILLSTSLPTKIKIIDTDFYCLQIYKKKEQIYKENLKRIFQAVIDSLLPEFSTSYNFFNIEDLYLLGSNGYVLPSVFLKSLVTMLRLNDKTTDVQILRKSI